MVSEKLNKIIEPTLNDLGFSLVRVRFSGVGADGKARSQLQIMAEPIESREMTVEDCTLISRQLAAVLDVEDPISEAYQLEVSSPGMDRPLTRLVDFTRFSGELAKVSLLQARNGQKRFRGRLGGVDEGNLIRLDTGTGRVSFSFEEIDTAKIDPTEFFSTLKQQLRRDEKKNKAKDASAQDDKASSETDAG
jgi:ribosome maturation factor RimP